MFPNLNLLPTKASIRTVTINGVRVEQLQANNWQKGWYTQRKWVPKRRKDHLILRQGTRKDGRPANILVPPTKVSCGIEVNGTYGTYGEITEVDASIGAPSGHAIAILIYPSGTPTSTPSCQTVFPLSDGC